MILRLMVWIIKHERERLIRFEQGFTLSFDADDEVGACTHYHYTKCGRHKDDKLGLRCQLSN